LKSQPYRYADQMATNTVTIYHRNNTMGHHLLRLPTTRPMGPNIPNPKDRLNILQFG
jgi:hypothetical protein